MVTTLGAERTRECTDACAEYAEACHTCADRYVQQPTRR
jgi:hypothetical protein